MEYLQYVIVNNLNRVQANVLNLVINGIPSIQGIEFQYEVRDFVLNLVINGIPSILQI